MTPITRACASGPPGRWLNSRSRVVKKLMRLPGGRNSGAGDTAVVGATGAGDNGSVVRRGVCVRAARDNLAPTFEAVSVRRGAK